MIDFRYFLFALIELFSLSSVVMRSLILTQYRRVTDRRTHGRICRSILYSACKASLAVGMGGTQNFVHGIYREKKYRGTGYTAVLVLW